MKNIFFVMATKCGAGKTTLATQFLPMTIAVNTQQEKLKSFLIDLYLIDSKNSNNYTVDKSSLIKLRSSAKAENTAEVALFTKAIEKRTLLGSEDDRIIVDIGGGTDTSITLKSIANSSMIEDSVIIVPFFLTPEYIYGAKSTIDEIRAESKSVKILLVANKLSKDMQDEINYLKLDTKTFIYDQIEVMTDDKIVNMMKKEATLTYLNDLSATETPAKTHPHNLPSPNKFSTTSILLA